MLLVDLWDMKAVLFTHLSISHLQETMYGNICYQTFNARIFLMDDRDSIVIYKNCRIIIKSKIIYVCFVIAT